MGRLDGKVALITGAGSGMGRLAAEVFVREGACVVASDLQGDAAAETVRPLGDRAVAVAGDVSREADVVRMVRTAIERFGRLTVLYNNAGIFPAEDESVLTLDEAVWDRTMAINVKGVAFCCKHGIPELIKAGGGSVINIASFVALMGCSVPQDAYTASKGAVISLTRSLAVQFGPRGVRSNAICPGPIETPLMRDLLKDENKKRVRLNRIPMGRFGHPDDVVNLGVYLASDESSWTNGAALVVDGGISVNYF
ncbi:MAG TPA: SDR family oxidoreductase [Candidatus Limnocylindrales bacterium]|nr:SDR family oxidoreductase [Candidatus Limnocylindrales bacterium]